MYDRTTEALPADRLQVVVRFELEVLWTFEVRFKIHLVAVLHGQLYGIFGIWVFDF